MPSLLARAPRATDDEGRGSLRRCSYSADCGCSLDIAGTNTSDGFGDGFEKLRVRPRLPPRLILLVQIGSELGEIRIVKGRKGDLISHLQKRLVCRYALLTIVEDGRALPAPESWTRRDWE